MPYIMTTLNEILPEIKVEDKTIEFNGKSILVKQYLPAAEKAQLIEEVNTVIANSQYVNELFKDIVFIVSVVKHYTNINLEIDENTDVMEMFDKIITSGLWKEIYNTLNKDEYCDLKEYVDVTIKNYDIYHNSALGIAESIIKDYKDLDLDVTKIQEKLDKGEGVEFLKEVINKMG